MLNGVSCDSMYANPIQKTTQVCQDAGRRCFCRAAFEWQKARSHQMEETGEEDWKCPIIRWVHLENLRDTAIFTSKFYGFPWMLRHFAWIMGSRWSIFRLGFCRPPKAVRAAWILSSADLWFTDDTGKTKSKKDRSSKYFSGFLPFQRFFFPVSIVGL